MAGAVVVRDLTLRQGLPFEPKFTWEKSDQSPVDLSGVTRARMEARPAPGDSHLLLSFDTDDTAGADGKITLGGADGTIALDLPIAKTWDYTRAGVYDLVLYQSGDFPPVRFAQGRLLLDPGITRLPVSA